MTDSSDSKFPINLDRYPLAEPEWNFPKLTGMERFEMATKID